MKNVILSVIFLANVLVSCNTQKKEKASNEQFACPMHPEMVGVKGETCSICGMDLTVPVKANRNGEHMNGEHHMDGQTHIDSTVHMSN